MSLATVTALIDRGRASARLTQLSPHKFECDDKQVYVVKPNRNDRQFANDLLAFALARLVDVPVFNAALVIVSKAFLSSSPILHGQYPEGVHFGSIFPSSECFDGWNASPNLVANEVANASDFYRLAVFDEMIFNGDRGGNPGNVVFVRSLPPPQEFVFRAIDHGNAFMGPAWTATMLNEAVPSPLVPVLAAARDLLVSRAKLIQHATEVDALADRLNETIDRADSGIADDERVAVAEFARRRSAAMVDWVSGPIYSARLPALL